MPHEGAGHKLQLLLRTTLFRGVYIARKSRALGARKGFKSTMVETNAATQHGAFALCSRRPNGSKPVVSDLYPGPHLRGEACAVKHAGRSPDGETRGDSLLLSVAIDQVQISGEPSKQLFLARRNKRLAS